MPLLPHKRLGGRREGSSRRRRGVDGASLVDSSDGISTDSGDDGASPSRSGPFYESRYHEIVASRLGQLELPAGADEEDGSNSADLPNLPSTGILQALTRKSFHDDDLRAALVEYQIQIFLNETQGRDGESDSAVVAMDITCTEPDTVITEEEHFEDCEELGARIPDVDTYTGLDQEQANKLHLKHALYRIKAALLLKGKPADELDAAALERKYPAELIVENKYFFHYITDGYFGWYFDSDLCFKKSLTDYQRLVLLNDNGGDEYTSWRRYRALYSTPEADRDYLQYWDTIVKKIKWLERYVLINESSLEWVQKRSKAMFQAFRIAVGFPNMTLKLAAVGFHEFISRTRIYLMFLKDLDGIYFEIWNRLNMDHQLRFRDALKQVYDTKMFSAHDRSMNYELEYGNSHMERSFRRCTKGISDSVPEYKARELIAQEIRCTRRSSGTYERYARKKLKIAELLGLIPKDKIAAA